MDAGLVQAVIGLVVVVGGVVYKFFRSSQAEDPRGSGTDDLQGSAPGDELPPGYRRTRRERGWTLTSGPDDPWRVRADVSWAGEADEVGSVRVDLDGPTMSEVVARVFAGEATPWHYQAAAWICPVRRSDNDTDLLAATLGRVAEAQRLFGRMTMARHFDAEALAALEHPDAATEATRSRIGEVLVVHVARRAIRLRHEARTRHAAGGLSMAVEGGGLAFPALEESQR